MKLIKPFINESELAVYPQAKNNEIVRVLIDPKRPEGTDICVTTSVNKKSLLLSYDGMIAEFSIASERERHISPLTIVGRLQHNGYGDMDARVVARISDYVKCQIDGSLECNHGDYSEFLNLDSYESVLMSGEPMVALTSSEMTTVLELARRCLADADLFDEMAEELDMSDSCMSELRDKIIGITGEARPSMQSESSMGL